MCNAKCCHKLTFELLTRKKEYELYLKTEEWFALREQRWKMDNYECVLCGNRAQTAHHRRYPVIFGTESIHDIISLCHKCHKRFHFPPSIDEVKKELMGNAKRGSKCPCCSQFVKFYQRKLNSSMAASLILIDKYFKQNPDEEWLHVENYFKTLKGVPASLRGDFPKLRHWELLLPRQGKRGDGSPRIGYYTITQKGKDFVSKKISVAKHVVIYNQEIHGFTKDQVNIEDCLGDKFDYNELFCENYA